MGVMLSSEWPQVHRERQQLLLPESCLRGVGWLPTLGMECTGEQHGQHRTLNGPKQTLVLGSLPEEVLRRGLQRPSLRVEAGEGPGGTRRMGQREHPTFS